jgi:hypothetical protein
MVLFQKAVIVVVLALMLASCGDISPKASKANRKLRRAERLIKQAELLGASWKRDTVFTEIAFHVPGVEVEFTPKLMSSKPMIFRKDSVITKVIIKQGPPGKPDTVEVATKCPDCKGTVKAPTQINNKIKAEKSFWQRSWLFFVGLFAGAIATFWVSKLGPARNLSITVDNKKQDS